MKIEIWLDFTCPYCYLGNKNLEVALKQTQLEERTKIEYKSFRIDYSALADLDKSEYLYHLVKDEQAKSKEAIEKRIEQMNEQAERVGITFQFNQVEYTDTLKAHRLTKYAESQGKEQELIALIFKKYFSQNENIGDKDVLLKVAQHVGLNYDEVDSLLCLNQYAKSVSLDEEMAQDLGIDKVPFFIFNEQFAVAGAQSIEVWLEVLSEVRQDLNGNWEDNELKVETSETTYCTGSQCGE